MSRWSTALKEPKSLVRPRATIALSVLGANSSFTVPTFPTIAVGELCLDPLENAKAEPAHRNRHYPPAIAEGVGVMSETGVVLPASTLGGSPKATNAQKF